MERDAARPCAVRPSAVHPFFVPGALRAALGVRFHSVAGGARVCNPVGEDRPVVELLDPRGAVVERWDLDTLAATAGSGSCGQWNGGASMERGDWRFRFAGNGYVAATASASGS